MCVVIENRSTKFSKQSIKNNALREYANLLAQDAINIRANLLHMSCIMATIASKRDEGILDEFDGSIVKFGEERLGIKSSQVYSMVNVGATFLDENGKSLLTEKGGKWSNTQFMALLPMGGTGKTKKSPYEILKACEQLVADGKIKPSMTVAQIKEVVKENRPDAKAKSKKEDEKKQREKTINEIEKKVEQDKATTLINLTIVQMDDGSLRTVVNGEISTFGENDIRDLVALMRGSTNYEIQADTE